MGNAVLVIDMLRGFLEEEYPLYCGDEARHIIPNIQSVLQEEIAKDSKIFYICDRHNHDDLEFKMFPPHAIEGTAGAEIIPELTSYPEEIIPKRRYSGFFDTPLEDRLKELKPEKLIICGVLTDICVLHTTADARNRDYEVEVPVDCVASADETAHKFALEHIQKVLGAKLTISRGKQ